jgi:hypothetical protein
MLPYQKTVGEKKATVIAGTRCDRCGFTLLDDDEGVWSAVGL